MTEPAIPHRKSILVVDDDFDVRSAVAGILEEEGYTVVQAAHGADALAKLQGGPLPDLILLDLMMPVMDGWTFCQRWHVDPVLSRIPVFIISADATTAQKATACGSTGYMKKPIQLNQLLDLAAQYAD